jgi:hypothetical protein
MLHRPSRLLFEIYLRRSADAARLSMFDLVACLVHVCDGYEVPAAVALLRPLRLRCGRLAMLPLRHRCASGL